MNPPRNRKGGAGNPPPKGARASALPDNFGGGAAGNVAYGGTVNPPRNRKGGAGNPPPTGARASALPDVQRD